MLELAPTDTIVRTYLRDIQRLKQGQRITHETGLRVPFHNLLDKAARRRGWTLIDELAAYSGGRRVVPDGTLAGIPPEAFDYGLGSRSALEWVIDQYQLKGESDPNRPGDPGYIVRLVGQVVRVSLETVRIVQSLPPEFS